MKLKLFKIQRIIKKNLEFAFLLLAIIVTIFSVRIYNINKNVINQNYINLTNNTYFQKNIKYIFNNLVPRYVDIEHKISKGETFDKILIINKKFLLKCDAYSLKSKEIKPLRIKKSSKKD